MSREESVRARANPSAPLLPWAFKEGKRAWDTRVSIYPRGVIVVRCMVIGRLAASILTAREPQITRKLKLPPYTPSTSSASSSSSHSSPDRAPIRRLNTLLGSYTALPWRFGFESTKRETCPSIEPWYFFHLLEETLEGVERKLSFFLSFSNFYLVRPTCSLIVNWEEVWERIKSNPSSGIL